MFDPITFWEWICYLWFPFSNNVPVILQPPLVFPGQG